MVDIKELVSNFVDMVFEEHTSKKIDLDDVWADVWERLIDELAYTHGLKLNPKMPSYPQFIEKSKNIRLEMKRLLIEEIKKKME